MTFEQTRNVQNVVGEILFLEVSNSWKANLFQIAEKAEARHPEDPVHKFLNILDMGSISTKNMT